MDTKPIIKFVKQRLAEEADPEKAVPMQRYMKTDMPFYGVQKPTRTKILRELKKKYPVETVRDYQQVIEALWQLKHREEKYLAIAFAQHHPKLITMSSLPLYKRMIIEGAWWDFVDDLAIRMVGKLWLDHRAKIEPHMDKWIEHDNLWLRRSAIIGQIKHKDQTDEKRLFSYALKRGHEKDFFIRKAIGWALREYAYADPNAVMQFLKQHKRDLQYLSYREASRQLEI